MGTPEEIDDDAREGFEILSTRSPTSKKATSTTSTRSERRGVRDAIGASEDDFEKVIAFLTYASEAYAEAPAE